MLKICNGTIIDSYQNSIRKADIFIDGGVIVKIAECGSQDNEGCDRVIDAQGLMIAPGFTDIHSHFRDPGFTHKEDIETGALCAARGGYTDVVLMANTKPAVDNVETLKYVLDKGLKTPINVHTCASVTKGLSGKELTDFETLVDNGAAGFTDDGIPIMDEEVLLSAFDKAAALDVPISLHEEDKRVIKENGINHGAASDYYGVYGSPRHAESKLIERDIKLAMETGVKLNIQHISSKEGVELVRAARKRSDRIFAEVTPHHLALTEEAMIEHGANAKMNPPLRTKKDRAALIEGVKDGTISIIATDHAPHSFDEKNVDITKAPSGIIGLETAFAVSYDALVKSGAVKLMQLIKMFTVNPKGLYGFKCDGISEGACANLTIFSENDPWIYTESLSKSANSPFLNCKFNAKIKYTICKGEIAYEDI